MSGDYELSNVSGNPRDPLASAIRLTPLIREHADQTERDRCLAQPVVAAMHQAELLSLGLPAALGGTETPVAAAMHVIEQVAYADGSTGWNVMIAYDAGLWSGYLSSPATRTLIKSLGAPVIAGSIQPPGRLERTARGYRLTGQWRFGSGCRQADAFFVAAILHDGDTPVAGTNGMPEMRQIVLRAADVKIVDTWHVVGMRGTGSHDFKVDNLAVAEEFIEPFNFDVPTEAGPLYRFPLMGNMALAKTAVALGIARRAIESFSELARRKVATHQTNLLRERAVAQRDLARAEACVHSARCFIEAVIDEVWKVVAAGREVAIEQRAMLRLAAVDGVQRAVEAVDLVFHAAGATSIHTSSPLERCFRDIHVVPAHFVVQPPMYEAAGRVMLGIPSGIPLF
jgi:alkylation response protein AidB-like acyl-CoA dehydrogenase